MNLFESGQFILHSGDKSNWKINCDVLTSEDITTLASMVYESVGLFRKAIGIPTGGLELANILQGYCFPNPEYPILIVDDVLTTGASMEKMKRIQNKKNHEVIGVVLFARGKCPDWVFPLFKYCGAN